MHISDFRLDTTASQQTTSALVSWECAGRPATRIHFTIPASTEIRLSLVPEAFLLACVAPAMAAGEAQIVCDAAIGPMLLRALPSALALIRTWSPSFFPARLAPAIRTAKPTPHKSRVARRAILLSESADAIDLLLSQPDAQADASPTIAVWASGLEDAPANTDLELAAQLCAARGIAFLPLTTNLRALNGANEFWHQCFAGFACAAVGHCLNTTIGMFEIANHGEALGAAVQSPSALHPTLLYGLGSEALDIWSPRVEVPHTARLEHITANPAAQSAMSVWAAREQGAQCLQVGPSPINRLRALLSRGTIRALG